jgi:cell division protein FtsB
MEKKIDIKTVLIVVLGIALIISFMFGQKNNIDNHENEISVLHKNNAKLLAKNDSLVKANKLIDLDIANINKQLDENAKKLAETQKQLDKLKNRKYENNNYVKHLSSHGVSVALSNYLENRAKSTDNR